FFHDHAAHQREAASVAELVEGRHGDVERRKLVHEEGTGDPRGFVVPSLAEKLFVEPSKLVLELPDDVAFKGLKDQGAGDGAGSTDVALRIDMPDRADRDDLAVDGVAQREKLAEDLGVLGAAGDMERGHHIMARERGELMLKACGGQERHSLKAKEGE